MKQTSTFTLLRVIAAMLCIALLITSGTFSVLATTALTMIPDLSDKNASLHSEPILENLANGSTEVRLPENAEELLSRLNEYASFTEEEKQTVLNILLPNLDKEKIEESAGQAKAAIIQEIEKMPPEAQAEMQIHSYMQAGKNFSDLEEIELDTLYSYLSIRSDTEDAAEQLFLTLESEAVNLFDSMLLVQLSADGLFTLDEAKSLLSRYDSRMERDREVSAFREFTKNFEKPTAIESASLIKQPTKFALSEETEQLRTAKSAYLNAAAFSEAKQLFLNGVETAKIRAAYSVGAALNLSPATLIASSSEVPSGSISISESLIGSAANVVLSETFSAAFPVNLTAVSAQLSANQNASVLMGNTDAQPLITSEEALLDASVKMQAELYSTGSTDPVVHKDNAENPPFLADLSRETGVSLNTGSSYHHIPLVDIPGINGKNLSLSLSYDSERANIATGTVGPGTTTMQLYAYIEAAAYAVVGSTELMYNHGNYLWAVDSIADGNQYISSFISGYDGSYETLETPYVARKAITGLRVTTKTITGTYSPFAVTGETTTEAPSYLTYSDADGYEGVMFPYYDGLRVMGDMVQTGENTWSITTEIFVHYTGEATYTTPLAVFRVLDSYLTAAVAYPLAYQPRTYSEVRCNIGAGWMWDLPSIEILAYEPMTPSRGCLYLPDKGKLLFENTDPFGLGYSFYNYEVEDMTLTTDTSYQSSQGYRSYYKLTYLDGSLIYFTSDGRILAEIDRMGNAITYTYNTNGYITGISNGYHSISILYTDTSSLRTVTIVTPDGYSHVLNLTVNPVSDGGDWLLTSLRYPDGTFENYSYSHQGAYINAQNQVPTNGILIPYALLTRITYSTGASLVYAYNDITTVRYNTLGCKQFFRVTERKWTYDGQDYNKQTFTYTDNYTNYPFIHIDLPSAFRYTTTIHENNGAYTKYEFDGHQKPVLKQVFDADGNLYQTDTWSYTEEGLTEYHSTTHPLRYDTIIAAERWIYDDYGRVTRYYLPLSYGDEYEYPLSTYYGYNNSFSMFIPQFVTYQTSNKVMYRTGYTLTPDGKNIAEEQVLENSSTIVARTEYEYDDLGNITAEKKYTSVFDFVQTSYDYVGGLLIKTGTRNVTNADGTVTDLVQTRYFYDDMGRLNFIINEGVGFTETTYDSMGRVTSVTSPEGRITTYAYDPILNTVLTTSGTDAPVLTDYNAFGLIESESIPSKNLTLKTYTYDTRLRLIRETNASGQTSSSVTLYTYDSLDRPVSMVKTSETGTEVYREDYAYNLYYLRQMSSRVTVAGAAGAPSLATYTLYTPWGALDGEYAEDTVGEIYGYDYSFDYTGNIRKISYFDTYSTTSVTNLTRDYYGNIVHQEDDLGLLESNFYDWLGRKTTSITPTNTYTLYTYDQLNRVIQETVSGTNYQTQKTYSYDTVGNVTGERITTSPLEAAVITYGEIMYSYDSDGNLTNTSVWADADTSSNTRYTYDANGRMTAQYAGMNRVYNSSMTAADYQLTQYVYNDLGQQIFLTDPLGQTESYEYDANGYLITKVLRDGTVNRFTYNALGKVVTDNVYASTASTTPLSAKTYAYYPTGAVKSITEDGTTVTYTYDGFGNLITETTGTTVHTYGYDDQNNRTSHTLTVDGVVLSETTYTYDSRHRMTGVTGAQGTTFYFYNLDNTRWMEITQTSENTQIATAYTYAATGVLSGMITQDMTNGVTLSQTAYTYYTDGNVYTETDVLANATTTYTYDRAGRLITEVSPAGTYSYTYDRAGNRASMTENGTTTTYTYDANNRLLTETKSGSVKSYTYDANGNTLTGDGATYTYDARGRQSGYVKGSAAASYTYYPTGLRKTKMADMAVTTYVWDGSNMVLEYTGSAASGQLYVYGLTLISQGNSWYYIYNAHGDVVKYIDESGAVLKSYDYDAFGEEANPTATDANPFRYAGQYFDAETGTYYLRARYYSPALGRFTQQDAWGYGNPSDPLSLNLYVYCRNNPIAFIDFTGNWPTWSQIGSAVLIVAVATVSVAAIVATAGAAGAAIGTGVAMYLGASASTAITLSTIATVGAYGVAAGVGAVAVSDVGEVLTGHNVIRDDLMGGNQTAYDTTKLVLGAVGDAVIQTGANFAHEKAKPSSKKWTADDIQFSDKFAKNGYNNQPQKRGWTTEMILSAVNNPVKTGTAVNRYTGNSVTAYYIDSVHYVAIDDVTKKIIQVADMNKPNWRFDLSK